MKYRLGVDVGGTNMDAAILDDKLNVLYTVKAHTTKDVQTGIYNAIKKVIEESKIEKKRIQYAMLGTTKSTNAIVERKDLNKVAYVRIGKPGTVGIPPYMEWPSELEDAIELKSVIIHGGYEFDGRHLADLRREEIDKFCESIQGKTTSIAIAGVFAPVNNEQELQVAKWIKADLGEQVNITLSHQIGGVGLLERENASILNAALMTVGQQIVDGFNQALYSMGIKAITFFSQNDGTLKTGEFTKKYPIFTIGCGPTNSIRGAYHLSGIKNALVLDVGGTTSDIGVLVNSFPRQSVLSARVGGVETNFRMPDILSIGIGGGTIIHDTINGLKIGPDSVGYEIINQAKLFGGQTETASDIAARLNRAFIDKRKAVKDIPEKRAQQISELINDKITNCLDQMKTKNGEVPLILTGGGSFLIDKKLKGISKVYQPKHFDAANAVGAALGQVSGETNKIYSFVKYGRAKTLEIAKKQAIEQAIDAGANPNTVNIMDVDVVPLAYLPGNSAQVKIKAVGNLDL